MHVKDVAGQAGSTPSKVALAWTLRNPAVASTIIGARTSAQLEDNLGVLDVNLSDDRLATLEKASAIELGFPHEFLARPMTRNVASGGAKVEARR